MAAARKTGGALTKEPPKPKQTKEQLKALEQYNKAAKDFKKAKRGTAAYDNALNRINKYGPQTGNPNWNAKYANLKPITDKERFMVKTPKERQAELEWQAQERVRNLQQQGEQFDVNRPYAGYEMGFGEARDKAYSDVMSQFERSMAPEFQRQNAEFQQRMADQGLDPNSGAYQAQYRALANAQNEARLNAQSTASQQAYQVQKQAFEQGQQASLQPLEYLKASQPYWQVPYEQGGAVNLANIQGVFGLKQQEMQNKAALEQARLSSGTSMSIARMQQEAEDERWRRQQVGGYPQGNPPKQPGAAEGFKQTLPIGIASAKA